MPHNTSQFSTEFLYPYVTTSALKRWLLIWVGNINYKCLKTKCSAEYLDIRGIKQVANVGYYVTKTFIMIYAGHLELLG